MTQPWSLKSLMVVDNPKRTSRAVVRGVHVCPGVRRVNHYQKTQGLVGYRVWYRDGSWQVVLHEDGSPPRLCLVRLSHCPWCGAELADPTPGVKPWPK